MTNETPSVPVGGEGSNCQLLEVAQGLDELLPNQFLCFTSKRHWRMDYSSGSVKVDNAQGYSVEALLTLSGL
jgi:hypothetical protein